MRVSVLLAVAAGSLLLSSFPAMADPAAAPAAPAATADTNSSDADRISCRTGAAPTGTRIGATRVCHTQREWDDIQRQSQLQLMKIQQQGLQGGAPGG